jgi:hypothetical protein
MTVFTLFSRMKNFTRSVCFYLLSVSLRFCPIGFLGIFVGLCDTWIPYMVYLYIFIKRIIGVIVIISTIFTM